MNSWIWIHAELTSKHDITVMQMYLIEFFFEKKNVFHNLFDLLGNGCLRFAKFKGFFVLNSMLQVGRLYQSCMVDSSPQFVAIISFLLSLGKLEQWLSSN